METYSSTKLAMTFLRCKGNFFFGFCGSQINSFSVIVILSVTEDSLAILVPLPVQLISRV